MSETDTHEVSKKQSGGVFLIKLGVEIVYVILQCTDTGQSEDSVHNRKQWPRVRICHVFSLKPRTPGF